jgi:hypothetical protein
MRQIREKKQNIMNITSHPLLACACLLLLCACTRAPQPANRQPPPFKPSASIQDLMSAIVDPSADALWESVSTETTSAGTVEKQPRSDQEWLAVRRHAIALLEAGNLLMINGRAVTHAGKATEDAHVDGVSTPQQVRLAIDAAPAQFQASALLLHDAAADALQAVDARDVAKLLAAGARLDHACESCHSVFWYPNAKQPPATWPAPLTNN